MEIKRSEGVYIEVAPPVGWVDRWWKLCPEAVHLAQREWRAYDEDEWKVFDVDESRHVMLVRSFPFWIAEHPHICGLGLVERREEGTVCKVTRFFRKVEGSIENAHKYHATRRRG